MKSATARFGQVVGRGVWNDWWPRRRDFGVLDHGRSSLAAQEHMVAAYPSKTRRAILDAALMRIFSLACQSGGGPVSATPLHLGGCAWDDRRGPAWGLFAPSFAHGRA